MSQQNSEKIFKYFLIILPEDIWLRRKGGYDVGVKPDTGKEVQNSCVYPEVGQTDVEDDEDTDGKNYGAHEGEVPGPRLEPKFDVDYGYHGGVNAEAKTELAQRI